jgi:hypothetical protein
MRIGGGIYAFDAAARMMKGMNENMRQRIEPNIQHSKRKRGSYNQET